MGVKQVEGSKRFNVIVTGKNFIKVKVEGIRANDPINKVEFGPKSAWQKDDCINRSVDYNCPNQSVLEATYGSAMIRCCKEKRCMQKAAKKALMEGATWTERSRSRARKRD